MLRALVEEVFVRWMVLALLMMAGCAKPVSQGRPILMPLPDGADPSVVWMLRPFMTERDGAGTVELWGLFACYRTVEPGEPTCYLANTVGTEEALVWPDDAKKYRIEPPK